MPLTSLFPTNRPPHTTNSNKTGQAVSYDRCLEVCLESSTRKTHHHGFRLAATGRSAAELKESIKDALEEGVFKPVTQVGAEGCAMREGCVIHLSMPLLSSDRAGPLWT